MDFGFHNCISRALLMHVSAEEGRQRSVQNGMDTLSACINSFDSRLDKQRFLEYNHSAFMIPRKLEFQGQKSEDVSKKSLTHSLRLAPGMMIPFSPLMGGGHILTPVLKTLLN